MNKSDPAFPIGDQSLHPLLLGMTVGAYAAIRLRVPESGIDWLDVMIREAKRDEFAGTCPDELFGNRSLVELQEMLGLEPQGTILEQVVALQARLRYCYADAMLAAREKENR